MSRRPALPALILSALALVAAVSWWRPQPPPPASQQAASTAAAPAAGSAQPSGLPSPALADPASPIQTADDGLATADLWAAISDPANSDLPPELFAELTQLGVQVVIADATGAGRQRWPHHWPGGQAATPRADVCCNDIIIHAAGTYTDPLNPGLVQVTVVWSAQTARGQLHQVSTVHLARRDNTWQPLTAN